MSLLYTGSVTVTDETARSTISVSPDDLPPAVSDDSPDTNVFDPDIRRTGGLQTADKAGHVHSDLPMADLLPLDSLAEMRRIDAERPTRGHVARREAAGDWGRSLAIVESIQPARPDTSFGGLYFAAGTRGVQAGSRLDVGSANGGVDNSAAVSAASSASRDARQATYGGLLAGIGAASSASLAGAM